MNLLLFVGAFPPLTLREIYHPAGDIAGSLETFVQFHVAFPAFLS